MQKLSPEMQAELQRRFAAGEPLPPNVVPMQGGLPPRPGGLPPGFSTSQPARVPESVKAQLNPIPSGDEGIAAVREHTKCELAPEAIKLNDIIPKLMEHKTTDETLHESIDSVIGRGLAMGIRGRRHCESQLKKRKVCLFDKDEKLGLMAADIAGFEEEAHDLETKLREVLEKGRALLKERFEYAVKTYGLSVEKYFYQVDDEQGCVVSVDLDCSSCKGVTKMRKARQEAADLLNKIQNSSKVKETGDIL